MRPEQVGVVVGVDGEDLAVGRDDFGADQVVDRQPVAAHEVPDAAAGRDPAEADRGRIAEADDEPVRSDRRGHLACGKAGPGPDAAGADVEVDLLELAQVDDDAAVRRAVAGIGVPAAADGELGAGLTSEAHDPRDVVGVRDPHDRARTRVDAAVRDGPSLVVVGIARDDHAAFEALAELVDREGGGCGAHRTSSSAQIKKGFAR